MAVSLIFKLLGWTKLPQWALELLAVGTVALGIWMLHLHTLHVGMAEGIAKQQAADDAASTQLLAQAATETAEKLKVAEAASHAHDQELDSLRQFVIDHPLHGSLCVQPAAHYRGQGVLETGPAHAGDARSSPSARDLLPLSSRDSSVGPPGAADQLGMLSALAGAADRINATLREFQARTNARQSQGSSGHAEMEK